MAATTFSQRRMRALAATASFLVPLTLAGVAHAQSTDAAPASAEQAAPADASDAEIVVTGSRITRAPITDQPVATLGSDLIEQRGYTNVGQALQQLPGFGVPGNSVAGDQGSFGAGQTFANLYNLGSQRTLTLVNGMRFVSPATTSIFGAVAGSPVDLGQIAPSLVDRIEVVSVGGAPIYGSDAIAGTVNILLKKNYDGVEANGSYGLSKYGDGQDYNFSVLAGKNFAEGRGNITANFYYDNQNGITGAQRPTTYGGSSSFFGTALGKQSYANQLYSGGRHYNVFTNTGMPMVEDYYPILGTTPVSAITNAAGQALTFNRAGQLVPFQNGQRTGSSVYQAGGDGFAIGDYSNFLVASERYQGTLLAHYDISDSIRFNGEVWFSRNYATNTVAQPFYNYAGFGNAGDPNGNLILSTANPFLSTADRATIVRNLTAAGADPSQFYLSRANTDLSTGAFRTSSDLLRFVGGVTGDIEAGERKFTWEINGTYGRTISRTTSREIVTQNFFNALDATTDGSGNIICRPGYTNAAIATFSSTCAPLNIFGNGNASKAALDYITAQATTRQINKQSDIIADIKGDLVKLPGGFAKFVLGYEHRYESARFDPGAFYYGQDNGDGTRSQYGNSIPIDPVAGSYNTNEGFGEISLPFISPDNAVPAVYRLEVNAAGRYVKNSIAGGFWTYTGGATYAPVKDLTFRGNYTRSFRAPAITELFAPIGSVFSLADDPCDARYIGQGPNPARRAANCAAAGVPANFTSNIADRSVQGTSGGNPKLQNEVANSWTVGGVLQPSFLPGLTITSDYVNIKIKNEIASLTVTDLMNACYDSASGSSPYCNSFTRGPDSQVTGFASGNYNIGLEVFRALQTSAKWDLPLTRLGLPSSAGALLFDVNYLHTFRHYYQIGEGDFTKTVGGVAEPTDNFTATAVWATKSINWMWQATYYGPAKVAVNAADTVYQYPRVGAYVLFNSALGFNVNDRFSLRFNVNNVFNRSLPFPYALGSATSTRYYDAVMGRYMRVTAGIKF